MNRGTQSVLRLDGSSEFEGEWDPRVLADLLTGEDLDFWKGRRVLDIGGNTGGLSLELARRGASVTISEPDPYKNSIAKTERIIRRSAVDEGLNLEIADADLFHCHELDRHDTVLCLGLLYHFRHPQLVVDYLSALEPEWLFISSQTHPSDDLALFNRAHLGILGRGHLPDDTVLTGWHPTRALLVRMLEWAGFDTPISLTADRYDFPKKLPGATNSSYYKAKLLRPVNVEEASRAYLPR